MDKDEIIEEIRRLKRLLSYNPANADDIYRQIEILEDMLDEFSIGI